MIFWTESLILIKYYIILNVKEQIKEQKVKIKQILTPRIHIKIKTIFIKI
jgi:hypothetical protein